ncbi:hypothetical protein HK101_011325 [Irineochytrium annulatum]|nr:hypothetical protein HK101_011325 [Irineochytrium annulatum]
MLLFFKAALVAALSSAASALSIRGENGAHTIPNAFLVQLDAGATADPAGHVIEHLSTVGINADQVKIRTVINTDHFLGVSFTLPADAATEEVVTAIPSANNVFRVNARYAPPSVKLAKTDFPPEAIHTLTGVNEVRKTLGYTGKGIKVAVIDSGVYYLHPALGGSFRKPDSKVIDGYDLVGDAYSAANPTTTPDDDPIDNCSTESHGTHVAGIIAGDASNITVNGFVPPVPFTGVAPEASILAFRVFGCPADNTGTDVITNAIFMAAKYGADIINLSLGGGPSYADESDAVAAEIVGAQGHFVFGANGNDGASGIMVNSAPGLSRGGFGIASFDNVAINQPVMTFAGVNYPWSAGQTNSSFAFDQPIEIVANDLDADVNNVQNDGVAGPKVDATGKALLVRWGTQSGSVARCAAAEKAGAVACILYSNADSLPGILGGHIPSLMTSHTAGQAIVAALKAGQKPTIVVSQKQQVFNLPTAGTISSFSSPGLDNELHIKPDFGGIGGQVLSTISEFAGKDANAPTPYGVYSGTSMATPYSAGAAALLLQATNKGLDFTALKARFQNNAVPAKIYQSDLTDSVVNQGAGLLNVYNSIMSKTIITPSALELNDTKNTQQHYEFNIQNTDSVPITYTISSVGAAMVNEFVAGDDGMQMQGGTKYTADYATVTFAQNNDHVTTLTVTVPAGATKNVHVKFAPPTNAIAGLFPIYSGFITVKNGESTSVVPYAGMVGSWKDAPVWSRNSPSFTKGFLAGLGFPLAANATAATGAYDDTLSFAPLSASQVATVNVTMAADNSNNGVIILPVASTTSRYAKIEVLFAGRDSSILPPSIRHRTPLGYANAPGVGPLFFQPLQRNAPVKGQSIAVPALQQWFGGINTNVTDASSFVQLPAGLYKLKFSALKHFGRVGATGDSDYDVITSNPINIVY